MASRPDTELAARVLPVALYRALRHVFAQGPAGCMLVGGAALSGYYAGHRRSDDLDLFVRDAPALKATVLAVESLAELGTTLDTRQRTPQFYDALCKLEGHDFTVQVVVDAGLFQVGAARRAADGVTVAELETLLKQKSATLISRCSEKDLFDLGWLFRQFPAVTPAEVVALGAEIDAGMTAESALLSVTGAVLRKAACDFSFTQASDVVFAEVLQLRDVMARAFEALVRKQPIGPMEELIRTLKPRS